MQAELIVRLRRAEAPPWFIALGDGPPPTKGMIFRRH